MASSHACIFVDKDSLVSKKISRIVGYNILSIIGVQWAASYGGAIEKGLTNHQCFSVKLANFR